MLKSPASPNPSFLTVTWAPSETVKLGVLIVTFPEFPEGIAGSPKTCCKLSSIIFASEIAKLGLMDPGTVSLVLWEGVLWEGVRSYFKATSVLHWRQL